eukprot:scaffold36670_cov42-Phaeocystis_antarctica.AAC.2
MSMTAPLVAASEGATRVDAARLCVCCRSVFLACFRLGLRYAKPRLTRRTLVRGTVRLAQPVPETTPRAKRPYTEFRTFIAPSPCLIRPVPSVRDVLHEMSGCSSFSIAPAVLPLAR